MVEGIVFKADRFRKADDYNRIYFKMNTVILCKNYKLMDSLTKEIVNTINGNAEYNDYCCDDEDTGKAVLEFSYGLQRIIDINGQKISIGLEPSLIYKANEAEDVWLFDSIGTNEIDNLPRYEEFIYPMLVFKGSNDVWKRGKDATYKMICNGRYGCYTGEWVDLKGVHFNEEIHHCHGKE